MQSLPRTPPRLEFRPFDRQDFDRLISWVPTAGALGDWCASFFTHPLTCAQLQRYLDSAEKANARVIFTAVVPSGEAVGHAEIGHIWPHLSSRLSRILVAPGHRRNGFGGAMVASTVAYSFTEHHVDRIDLGVASENAAAIDCYHGQGFRRVGKWPRAMEVAGKIIDVCWMTIDRKAWSTVRDATTGKN